MQNNRSNSNLEKAAKNLLRPYSSKCEALMDVIRIQKRLSETEASEEMHMLVAAMAEIIYVLE